MTPQYIQRPSWLNCIKLYGIFHWYLKGWKSLFKSKANDNCHVTRYACSVQSASVQSRGYSIGPISAYLRSAIQMAFRWRANSDPHLYTGWTFAIRKRELLMLINSHTTSICAVWSASPNLLSGYNLNYYFYTQCCIGSLCSWVDRCESYPFGNTRQIFSWLGTFNN